MTSPGKKRNLWQRMVLIHQPWGFGPACFLCTTLLPVVRLDPVSYCLGCHLFRQHSRALKWNKQPSTSQCGKGRITSKLNLCSPTIYRENLNSCPLLLKTKVKEYIPPGPVSICLDSGDPSAWWWWWQLDLAKEQKQHFSYQLKNDT